MAGLACGRADLSPHEGWRGVVVIRAGGRARERLLSLYAKPRPSARVWTPRRGARSLLGSGGDHAGEVAALGMTALVGKLAALNEELTRALQAERDTTSHDELRRSQREAHELFCRAVAWILGHLDPDDPTQGEARARLLEPLDVQQEAEAARRRASAPNPSKGGE